MLRADSTGTGIGTVRFTIPMTNYYPASRVDFSQSTGSVSIFYNPPSGPNKYQNPTIFSCSGTCSTGGVLLNSNQPFQLTAYMLVNDSSDLQSVNTSVSRPNAYALGRDIDASSIANFNPLGNGASAFSTAVFDGQNYTISNLTIAPNDSTTHNVGLFGVIGPTGVVRNLNLANVDVSANPGVTFQTVGRWPAPIRARSAMSPPAARSTAAPFPARYWAGSSVRTEPSISAAIPA